MPKKTWLLALIVVLFLLFVGNGFRAEDNPYYNTNLFSWSQVHYDPTLTITESKCEFTSFGIKHQTKVYLTLVRPDVINFVIRMLNPDELPKRYEALEGTITKGMFLCFHKAICIVSIPNCHFAKRKELTLNKRTYQKGDVVTGRIDFECSDEPIIVKGVFKTILK